VKQVQAEKPTPKTEDSSQLHTRVPESLKKEFLRLVVKRRGRLYGTLGEETANAIKLYVKEYRDKPAELPEPEHRRPKHVRELIPKLYEKLVARFHRDERVAGRPGHIFVDRQHLRRLIQVTMLECEPLGFGMSSFVGDKRTLARYVRELLDREYLIDSPNQYRTSVGFLPDGTQELEDLTEGPHSELRGGYLLKMPAKNPETANVVVADTSPP
jgi:hypothetical protein